MKDQQTLFETVYKLRPFLGLKEETILFLLCHLQAHLEPCKKGQLIFEAGHPIREFALLIAGTVDVVQYDFWGNRSIVYQLPRGSVLGIGSAVASGWAPPATITAAQDCLILFLDMGRFKQAAGPAAEPCAQLSMNLITLLAERNINLVRKINLLTQRTTRNKMMVFLSACARQAGKNQFDIPFSRQELADFLAVERTALSKELSRMKQDGLITYQRNHFILQSDWNRYSG